MKRFNKRIAYLLGLLFIFCFITGCKNTDNKNVVDNGKIYENKDEAMEDGKKQEIINLMGWYSFYNKKDGIVNGITFEHL